MHRQQARAQQPRGHVDAGERVLRAEVQHVADHHAVIPRRAAGFLPVIAHQLQHAEALLAGVAVHDQRHGAATRHDQSPTGAQ